MRWWNLKEKLQLIQLQLCTPNGAVEVLNTQIPHICAGIPEEICSCSKVVGSLTILEHQLGLKVKPVEHLETFYCPDAT